MPSFRDRLLAGRNASATFAASGALASPEWRNASGLEIFASPFGGWMNQKKNDGYAGYVGKRQGVTAALRFGLTF